MRVNGTLYFTLKDHLGSASVVTDSAGTIVGEQRYYPFGETRLATGSMYTDKLFTGQRNIAGLGIYHYQSRFPRSAPEAERRGYSPKLGRFLSADSLVPNPFNPQDYNRYSYVRNNPVRYTDPSGHACVEGTSYCVDPMTRKKSGSLTSYNDYGAPPPCTRNCGGGGLPALPSLKDVPNPEGATPEVQQATADSYLEVREILWEQCGSTCVDPSTGKIADKYLVALIISGEFGVYKGGQASNVYLEGLEAVSNQYYSASDLKNYTYWGNMLCNGGCTVSTQLSWLYDIEAVRTQDFISDAAEGDYEKYLDDAALAVAPGGYSNGTDSSWNWGNITKAELNNFCITAQASPSFYDDTDYFIVYSCQIYR